MRRLEDGSESPYELNSTYFSALSDGQDEELGMARFQCSQAVVACNERNSSNLFSLALRYTQRFGWI